MTRVVFIALGSISLALAALGAVLPLLPATPFIILAGLCFSRSSPRLHTMLRTHPVFGPALENWRLHRAISGRAKLTAIVAMAATWLLSLALQVSAPVLAVQTIVLLGVAVFILTRPSVPIRDPASTSQHQPSH